MSVSEIEAMLRRIGLDRYMMLLILTVLLATFLPARGEFALLLSHVTYWAVALLFFLYGAKLSTATILAGLTNWRLQLAVLALTFMLFPLLGLAMKPLSMIWLPAAIGVGFLYIGCMPSTVQSSIAFTSVSGGKCVAKRWKFAASSPLEFAAVSSSSRTNSGVFGSADDTVWLAGQRASSLMRVPSELESGRPRPRSACSSLMWLWPLQAPSASASAMSARSTGLPSCARGWGA